MEDVSALTMRARLDPARRNVERHVRFVDQSCFDHELGERDDRVAAHRAVALVVKEEDVEVGVRGAREHGAVHVGVPAGLEHQAGTQMIEVLAKVAPLLQHGAPFQLRQSVRDDSQRLAAGMHVDGRDAQRTCRRTEAP